MESPPSLHQLSVLTFTHRTQVLTILHCHNDQPLLHLHEVAWKLDLCWACWTWNPGGWYQGKKWSSWQRVEEQCSISVNLTIQHYSTGTMNQKCMFYQWGKMISLGYLVSVYLVPMRRYQFRIQIIWDIDVQDTQCPWWIMKDKAMLGNEINWMRYSNVSDGIPTLTWLKSQAAH